MNKLALDIMTQVCHDPQVISVMSSWFIIDAILMPDGLLVWHNFCVISVLEIDLDRNSSHGLNDLLISVTQLLYIN